MGCSHWHFLRLQCAYYNCLLFSNPPPHDFGVFRYDIIMSFLTQHEMVFRNNLYTVFLEDFANTVGFASHNMYSF